jgi:DNA-binding GntR family transcriptional regulator
MINYHCVQVKYHNDVDGEACVMEKREQAYDVIKQKILMGTLAPLSDIAEEELQKELGVSRTPIRDALIKLSHEGFVYIYPRKGTIVSEITPESISWQYEARELNEPAITVQACDRLPQEWLLEMRRAFMALPTTAEEANATDIRGEFIELDRELHSMILSTCQNVFLREMLQNVYDHSQRLRVRTNRKNEEYLRALGEHLEIINALIEQDPAKIEWAAREHICRAKEVAFRHYS